MSETYGRRKTLSEKKRKEPEHTTPKWMSAEERYPSKIQTARTCIRNKTKGKLCVNNCATCALYKQCARLTNKNRRKKRTRRRKTLSEKKRKPEHTSPKWMSPKERYPSETQSARTCIQNKTKGELCVVQTMCKTDK